MEKLIELLNEYGEYDLVEHKWTICKRDTDDEWEINIYTDYTAIIISKKFWFIKWLVDNNKIDWSKYGYSIEYTKSREGLLPLHRVVKRWDSIIMWLSIIEKPLEFLISILK